MNNSVAEIKFNIIERFIDAQLARGKSNLTAKTYRQAIEAFDKFLKSNGGNLNSLTRHDVQSYISHLEDEGKSATTVNKIFAVISVFAKFVKRPNITEDIRLTEVRKTRHIAPKSLERNERNSLLREIERKGNLRDIAIVYTLLHTGLRVSELVALKREDVVIGERSGSLKVRSGKGNVARTVPLSPEARLHISRYLASRTDNDPALFLSNYRKQISVRAVQHLLNNFAVYPHMLRHTFCRELVSKGVDISTVAELAGHADINVTRRYSKPSESELEQAINKAFS